MSTIATIKKSELLTTLKSGPKGHTISIDFIKVNGEIRHLETNGIKTIPAVLPSKISIFDLIKLGVRQVIVDSIFKVTVNGREFKVISG